MAFFGDDLRLALRTLQKNPVLTFVALASLAIGIGANTAIFTLTDTLLLRPLPVHNPNELVLFTNTGPTPGFIETSYGNAVSFSYPKYRALRQQSEVFNGVIARFPFPLTLGWQGSAERGNGELVTGNYFEVLGVQPQLGRIFTDDDDRVPGAHPVAILSHGYWTRRFGARPTILNQAIALNGHPYTVVGVAPRNFHSFGAGEAPDIYVPMVMKAQMTPLWDLLDAPHAYWLNVAARLKPGVSLEQAQAGIDVVWRRILAEDVDKLSTASAKSRERYLNNKLQLKSGSAGISAIRDDSFMPLMVLSAVVALVLLIACANVANLLLARAAAREKEIAIRISLGATRRHLVRQLLAESLLLSLGGGLLGLLFSSWAESVLLRLMPKDLPTAGISADPDGRVLLFTFLISVATGLVFGCIPALRATRPDVGPALKEQTSTPASHGHARLRKALVVAQIALSVILLAGAGLFVHSLYNLQSLDPGFRSDHAVTFTVNPALNGYTPERSRALFTSLEQQLAALPGVSGVTMAVNPLLTNSIDMSSFQIENYQPAEGKTVTVNNNQLGPSFFSVIGIPLIAGREITDRDTIAAPRVAIVNETFVKKYVAGRNPIGLHVTYGREDGSGLEIVGVVKDAKYDDLREKPKAVIYVAAAQRKSQGTMTFYVRTTLSISSLAAPLRGIMTRLDSSLPAITPRQMRDQVLEGVFLDRMVATLSSSFAVIATLLAAVGLYGVISWSVTRRKREIGIRMAMGARSIDVLRMILGEVAMLGAIGIAVAIPVWIGAASIIRTLLYGVSPQDPLALAASVALLATVALIAGFIPAWRASRVDPISAIRYE